MPIPALPPTPSVDIAPSTSDSLQSNNSSTDSAQTFAKALNNASQQHESASSKSDDQSSASKKDQTTAKSDEQSNKVTDKTSDKAETKEVKAKDVKDTKDAKPNDDATPDDTVQETPVATTPAVPVEVAPIALLVPNIVTDAAITPTSAATVTAITNAAIAAETPTTVTNPSEALIPTIASASSPAADIVITDPKTTLIAGRPGDVAPATQTAPTAATSTPTTTDQTAPYSQALSTTIADQVAAELTKLTSATSDAKSGTTQATVKALTEASAAKAVETLVNTLPTAAASTNVAISASKDVIAPAPSAPFSQVVSVIAPLRAQGDGNYSLTMQLHPESMGKVQVSMALHNGQISMQLSADNADARQLLRDGMNDLRQQLQSSGLSTGALDVSTGDHADQQFQSAMRNRDAGDGTANDIDDSEFFARLATALPDSSSDGSLDVRV